MATKLHSILTDADGLHEPKGVASAANGQVYVANGSGSGVWRSVGGSVFGDMHFQGNTVPSTIPVTNTDYILNGANLSTPGTLWVQGVQDSIVFSNAGNNAKLTVPVAGAYEVSFAFSMSGGAGGGNPIYRISIAVNGAVVPSHARARRQVSTTDVGTISMSEFIQLNAGDYVQIAYRNETNTNNITFSDGVCTMVLLRAT